MDETFFPEEKKFSARMFTSPGSTIDKWGPAAWNTLHSFAHSSDEQIPPEKTKQWEAFLKSFGDLLPCPRCRQHFKKYLSQHSDRLGSCDTRRKLVVFLNDAHNDVNRRLGKRVWSLEEHMDVYSLSRKRIEPNPSLLPLLLIFTIGVAAAAACGRQPHPWTRSKKYRYRE